MANKNDSLGDRMKKYEAVSKTSLVPRMPVILRLDGCHFHTTTRGFIKPFDPVMMKTMQDTMKYLCEHIQGCVFGYTQSDEITLIIVDYKKLNSSAWFDNEVQKMCSVAASMATKAFNSYFVANMTICSKEVVDLTVTTDNFRKVYNAYDRVTLDGAIFDCRAFNVPKEDVTNNILWRQQDATRNSIQALAQAHFSHKEMFGLSCNKLQDKLFTEKGINWNDLPIPQKRGSACIKRGVSFTNQHGEETVRTQWYVDTEMPILTGAGRDYVDSLIICNDD
jgi:tRNA(His) 5'-end guanylyltransferase